MLTLIPDNLCHGGFYERNYVSVRLWGWRGGVDYIGPRMHPRFSLPTFRPVLDYHVCPTG